MRAQDVAPRDFRGYGLRPPAVRWPGDARVAVSLVVNVEEGAEFAVSQGDARNEQIYDLVEEVVGAPDPCMESHFEYGPRAGWWRIMETLARFEAPATMNACGRAIELSPWMARDAVARGHEVSCHGWRWERHAGMTEPEERALIGRAVSAIATACGDRPVGFHTRSAASPHTRRLLVEEGGFLYDSNGYNDDVPYVVDVCGRSHVVLPYAFDTNDMRFQNGGGFVFGEDFARYCIAAFDRLWEEGATVPRMMTVGLHLRIIGRPARIGGLIAFLDHVRKKGGAWFARRDQIARHWRSAIGLPEWTPSLASLRDGSIHAEPEAR
jgi:peptidoglycan/xylan/chitin deacetylase (PgdA/CDA1 family)